MANLPNAIQTLRLWHMPQVATSVAGKVHGCFARFRRIIGPVNGGGMVDNWQLEQSAFMKVEIRLGRGN
jgi:hypothetical protein